MRNLTSKARKTRARIFWSFAIAASVTSLMLDRIAADDRAWLTGTVVEITQGTMETGANSTSTASSNGSTSTTTTMVTSIPYTEYRIQAGNKVFVVRPDPVAPRPSLGSKIGSHLGWGWLKPNAVPVTILANVGDSVSISPEGNRAWVRDSRGKEYLCSLVRQTLLSDPQPGSAKDSTNAHAATNPENNTNEQRPTLRRDK